MMRPISSPLWKLFAPPLLLQEGDGHEHLYRVPWACLCCPTAQGRQTVAQIWNKNMPAAAINTNDNEKSRFPPAVRLWMMFEMLNEPHPEHGGCGGTEAGGGGRRGAAHELRSWASES